MFEDAQRTMEGFRTLRNRRPGGRRRVRIENLVVVGVVNANVFLDALMAGYLSLGPELNGAVCPLTLLRKL